MKALVVLTLVVGFAHPQAGLAQGRETSAYRIVERDGKWQLLRGDAPFYVKGAVGWQSYDVLCRCGANSVRTGASQASLDRAHQAGLMAMANLPVRGERNEMDWDDDWMVNEQKQKVLRIVRELKDHPALMFWAVGNELDWIPPGVPYHPRLWRLLNDIAADIHRIDPNHPVMTVIGTGGYERKIQEIARDCPDMNLLGINTYGDIDEVAGLTQKFWPKPYVIAEWGPTGHWQVPKTKWRVPIEETSTEKARAIHNRYTKVIQADEAHCLGSFVFLWGQKQETTHTWYGLFQDGLETEAIGVMQYLWRGAWPQNRVSAVLALDIIGFSDRTGVYLKPAGAYEARVVSCDCDFDVLTYKWDIRPEVEIPRNSYAGGGEKPAMMALPGLIRENDGISRPPRPKGRIVSSYRSSMGTAMWAMRMRHSTCDSSRNDRRGGFETRPYLSGCTTKKWRRVAAASGVLGACRWGGGVATSHRQAGACRCHPDSPN